MFTIEKLTTLSVKVRLDENTRSIIGKCGNGGSSCNGGGGGGCHALPPK